MNRAASSRSPCRSLRPLGHSRATAIGLGVAVLLLAGCAATLAGTCRGSGHDPSSRGRAGGAGRQSLPATSVKPMPGAENLGKPGYYAVKPGDTLIRIGLENGQNWKDLVRWNELENPNLIEVGQVLRVVQPGTDPSMAGTRPITAPRVESRPLDAPKDRHGGRGSASRA